MIIGHVVGAQSETPDPVLFAWAIVLLAWIHYLARCKSMWCLRQLVGHQETPISLLADRTAHAARVPFVWSSRRTNGAAASWADDGGEVKNWMWDTYCLVFYAVFRASMFPEDREANRWRGLAAICVSQSAALFALDMWLAMFTGTSLLLRRVASSPVWLAALGVALLAVNYLALLRHDAWESYAKRFEQHSARGRAWRTLLGWTLFAVTIAIFVVTILRFVAAGRPGLKVVA